MTIRAQQINMSGYYTATQVDSLIPSTVNFATHAEVTSTSGILDSKITNTSGQLNTYISNTSGQLDSRITTNSTNLSNTSGQLDSRISADVSNLTNTSGQLNTRINNSGAYSATISGQLDTRINATGLYAANVSGQLDARITSSGAWVTTVSTNLANTSGQLDARITSSGAYMANVSGQLDARITSSGTYAVNISGQLDTKIINSSGQLSNRINNLTVATLSGVTINSPTNNQVLTYSNGIWINQSGTGGEGGGVTDHGALTGLDDDDHAAIYYNKTIIDTTSGILNTYISNTSGQLDSRITSDVTNLSNTSGQLNTRINNSGAYSAAVSGQLDARISATGLYAANVSGQLDSRITTNTTNLTNTSGQLSNRINNLTLATLSGMAIGTPASGQVISYNGTGWGNSVPAAGASTAVAWQANRDTDYAITSDTWNNIGWDAAWVDNAATFYHDPNGGSSTIRSKVYIYVPGLYHVLGQITWNENVTARRVRFLKNGAALTGAMYGQDIGATNTSGMLVPIGLSGDYLQFSCYAENATEYNQPSAKFRIQQVCKFD